MWRLGLAGLAGLAVGLAAEWVRGAPGAPGQWILDLATGWTLIGAGLVAVWKRPAHRDASHTNVDIVQDGEWLMITVEDYGRNRTSKFVDVADRVGAVGGRLSVEPTRLRAELPCG